MNETRLKVKEIYNCPVCTNKYEPDGHVPKLLPCGKTLCDECIEKKLERKSIKSSRDNCYYLSCSFCSDEHQLTKNGFPVNELLIALLNSSNEKINDELDESVSSSKEIESLRTKSEKYRKVKILLNEIEINSKDLDLSINTSKEKLTQYFASIEKEINSHTDKLIDDLRKSRDYLIKEIEMHKNSAVSYLNEGLNENSNLQLFRQDCKKNVAKLNKLTKANENNDRELIEIANLADELNEKIISTRIFFENCIKSDLKLIKSKYKIEPSLIGRLEFRKVKYAADYETLSRGLNSHRSLESTTSTTNTPRNEIKTNNLDLNRIKIINYSKVPFNTKNVLTCVLNNKLIVKVTEQSIIEDYSYKINLKLINSENNVIKKINEEMGSYRLKKIQASTFGNYIGIIFTNKFLDNYNCLKLYDGNQLKLIETIDLHYTPVDLFLNKSGIYVRSNNYNLNMNKYDYNLKHIKSFGQSVNTNDSYYIPQSAKLSFIHEEKLYFIDYENAKIRILNEQSGKYMKPLMMTDDICVNKNILISVDSYQRITLVSRITSSKLLVKIYSWEHVLLNEKKIDLKCDSIDKFIALEDGLYSVIDKKNQSIYFF
jgi:hypothetical protein